MSQQEQNCLEKLLAMGLEPQQAGLLAADLLTQELVATHPQQNYAPMLEGSLEKLREQGITTWIVQSLRDCVGKLTRSERFNAISQLRLRGMRLST
jgi:hypothetical protein